jgi:hypothetical protein
LFKLLSDSGSNFKEIPLALLSDEDMAWIINELLLRHGFTLECDKQSKLPKFASIVASMIHSCGGNPRFLSILIGICMK